MSRSRTRSQTRRGSAQSISSRRSARENWSFAVRPGGPLWVFGCRPFRWVTSPEKKREAPKSQPRARRRVRPISRRCDTFGDARRTLPRSGKRAGRRHISDRIRRGSGRLTWVRSLCFRSQKFALTFVEWLRASAQLQAIFPSADVTSRSGQLFQRRYRRVRLGIVPYKFCNIICMRNGPTKGTGAF